ncbi:hypothetical protein QFC19_001799 [Naganishia cerealis]|uniref:Uncharacterized protein n=1 Tax=Naganishia cerealis TaxID=610337 RepID=A0ACC2WF85_9TREE|nr:hypothetical protein QFC19_001799 [Naganishia cerealis]
MCQSASSAIVQSSVTTTNSAGSTITSGVTTIVPASQAPSGGRTSFLTVTVTDSSGQTQESVISSVDPSSKSGGTSKSAAMVDGDTRDGTEYSRLSSDAVDVGAIVGGTVGGVVGLLAILALLWFCVFKKRRDHKGDFDDTMVRSFFRSLPPSARLICLFPPCQFDPGRSRHAAPGQTDILDDELANDDVEPYTYGQNTSSGSPQMSQYATGYPASAVGGIAPSLPPLATMGTSTAVNPVPGSAPLTSRGSYSEASQSGGANVARGPSSASTLTSAGFAGRGAQPSPGQMPYAGNYYNAMPMPMPVPTGAGGQQQQQPSAAQQKAREAAQERQALRTANPTTSDSYYASGAGHQAGASTLSSASGGQISPGGTTTASGGVVVHSDGGRYVPADEEEGDAVDDGPSELPPQ